MIFRLGTISLMHVVNRDIRHHLKTTNHITTLQAMMKTMFV